ICEGECGTRSTVVPPPSKEREMAKPKKKKAKPEPTFIERLGKNVQKVGERVGKYLDSQKDAISRATRELEQAQEKLGRKEEDRRRHREQCDDYVHRRSCTKCDSLDTDIRILQLE